MECSFKSQRFFRRYDVIVKKIPRRQLAEKEIDTEKGKERVDFSGLSIDPIALQCRMPKVLSDFRVSLFLERNV